MVRRVALVKGDRLVAYKEVPEGDNGLRKGMYAWMSCTEVDGLSISPKHTLYVPCGPDGPLNELRVLARIDSNTGEPRDVTEEDVANLPTIMEADAKARSAFIASFHGNVFHA